jgi:hypothetical protein
LVRATTDASARAVRERLADGATPDGPFREVGGEARIDWTSASDDEGDSVHAVLARSDCITV